MMRKVGVLGGGQLGRMLGQAASQLNIPISILDVGTGPAKLVCVGPHVDGSFTDGDKIRELAGLVDVLTVEIEHVDVDALESVAGLVEIHPSPATIRVIQDKFLQKEHLRERGCAVGACTAVEGDKVAEAVERLGGEWPVMVKKRRLAYDGRGNYVARTAEEAEEAVRALGEGLYVEKWVAFKRELAVMVVRGVDGSVRSYAAVETVHRDNVCHVVYAPALSCGDARGVAEAAVRTFEGAGVFGVEMFEAEDGRLLINEIAPRPHNSGHLTIEACHTSQYENHLRAILGLPLGDTAMKVPAAAMLNLLGDDDYSPALSIPGASIHLYAKAAPRPGRKMGHITIVGNSHHEVRTRLALLTPPPPATPHPLVSIIMGSDSDLPTMTPAARILDDFGVPYELTLVSAHRTPLRLVAFAQAAASRGIRAIIAGAGGAAHLPGMVAALTPLPVVGVPVATKSSTLSGIDALYSIVQMPKGVPVATVAVNGAQNAALLVLRMLAPHDPAILLKMQAYITNLEQEVSTKIDRLDNVGWQNYN